MKKLLFLVLIFISLLADAQVFYRRSEFGISGGTAHYFGDLNQNFGFKDIGYSGSLFYKYNFTHYIALRLGVAYGHVGYADKYSTNYYQQLRNLDFQSNIFEANIGAEFHFFQYAIGDFEHRFTPYVSIGAGVFNYDPYTIYNNKRYRLKPLGTEGQNFEEYKDRRYSGTSVCFPIGLGVKFWLSKGLTLNLEAINRSTTTDYLDDVSTTYIGKDRFDEVDPGPYPSSSSILQDRSPEVSNTAIGIKGRQRGISTTRDQYLFFQLGLSFRLPTYRCPD
jgi:hypothetical protein